MWLIIILSLSVCGLIYEVCEKVFIVGIWLIIVEIINIGRSVLSIFVVKIINVNLVL